jgi:hypothetical protein
MGEWKDLELWAPRGHVERQSQRNPTRPGCDALACNACLVALHNTFATFYDASQNHFIQLTRGKVRWTTTKIRTPQENSSPFGVRRQESRGRIQTPESTEKTQADTYLHARTFAILKGLCQKENDKRVRTKGDSKGRGQSMVCGGYTRGKRFAVPHKV